MDSEAHKFRNSLIFKTFSTVLLPIKLILLYVYDVIPVELFYLGLAGLFFLFVCIPIIFMHNLYFQRNLIFLSQLNIPRWAEFKNPKHHGLTGTRNLYINTEDKCTLGTWHILPQPLIKDNLKPEEVEEYFEKMFLHNYPVIVYCHGNSSNRAAAHHVELHKILRRHYHVMSFDYRGFGDSTGCPNSEQAVVGDVMAIVQWVRKLTTAPIILWGHSIGTGLSTHAIRILEHELNFNINGLILENPFDNMRNEIIEHPIAWVHRMLPWFEYTFVEPMYKSGFIFKTDEHINHISCPVMILHAEDDLVVPIKLGIRLYNSAEKNRTEKQGSLEFHKFEKKYGYGHKYICRSPELPELVETFVNNCVKKY